MCDSDALVAERYEGKLDERCVWINWYERARERGIALPRPPLPPDGR